MSSSKTPLTDLISDYLKNNPGKIDPSDFVKAMSVMALHEPKLTIVKNDDKDNQ